MGLSWKGEEQVAVNKQEESDLKRYLKFCPAGSTFAVFWHLCSFIKGRGAVISHKILGFPLETVSTHLREEISFLTSVPVHEQAKTSKSVLIRARRLFKEPQTCESLTWQVFSSTNVKRWQFSTDKNGTVSFFFLYHTTKQELKPSE